MIDKILAEYKRYTEQSQALRNVWADCYDAYKSVLDETKNPYLANVYLPKTHEAVETLNAFLIGVKQIIRAKPASKDDTKKAEPVQRLIQYQWDKVLRARDKVETWAKQAILFGTGIIKVGWIDDPKKKYDDPFIEPVELPRFYADFFIKDIQDQESVIHEIITTESRLRKEYPNKKFIIAPENVTELSFKAADQVQNVSKKMRLLERWTIDDIITLAETADGWKILKKEKNPYDFLPFVKMVYKTSPLANRFYGIGAIEPSLKIQKAINNTINQMFDNITLINQKGFIKRRGATINPQDLVAKPGWIITTGDIDRDLKAIEIGDIKPSIQMLMQLLTQEFQEASGATNLLKGLGGAHLATEVALQQKNLTTILDRVTDHFHASLAELGQMLVEVNLENITTNKTIKLMENDDEELWMEVSPDEINGKFDIDIQVDRTAQTDRIIMSKQMIDFLAVASKNPQVAAQIDWLPIFKRWLEYQGFADVDAFFKKAEIPNQGIASLRMPEAPRTGQEISTRGLIKSATSPTISK